MIRVSSGPTRTSALILLAVLLLFQLNSCNVVDIIQWPSCNSLTLQDLMKDKHGLGDSQIKFHDDYKLSLVSKINTEEESNTLDEPLFEAIYSIQSRGSSWSQRW
jgi:hypothetical protein